MKRYRIPLNSQAHLQFAKAKTQTLNCKRASLFANAFLPTYKTKSGHCKIGNEVILNEMKRAQQVTKK